MIRYHITKLIAFSIGMFLSSQAAFACGEFKDPPHGAVIDWLKPIGAEACYYYEGNQQELDEGYLWLKTVHNPLTKRKNSFIRITFKEINSNQWQRDEGDAIATQTSYRTGKLGGCPFPPPMFHIRANDDGSKSVLMERISLALTTSIDALKVESSPLVFNRTDNHRCKNIKD